MHQLAPYVGKLKSGMARALVDSFSKAGDTVLDPFCGSGVVPLEAALLDRQAWANDLNPYAYVLTRGKLEAPSRAEVAFRRADRLLCEVDKRSPRMDLRKVPKWVRQFFHPNTLREVLAAVAVCTERRDFFLLSCLLGILHHQRPGFLSYPASHLVPYLRDKKFPRDTNPEMYEYRDVRSRLLAKIRRAYRKHHAVDGPHRRGHRVWRANAMRLPHPSGVVDAIITSPPYFGALDYARDNRLRLWFLGVQDWKGLEQELTAKVGSYEAQMSACVAEMHRVLKRGKHCVLIVGDVRENGSVKHTPEILLRLLSEATQGRLALQAVYDDPIPDERRSRRGTGTTKFERILVMRKT